MSRRLSLTLALIFCVAGCQQPQPVVEILRPSYLDAVRPIQIQTDQLDQNEVYAFQQNGWLLQMEGFSNICTASHINRLEHLWITAAHCVVGVGKEGRFIEGQPIINIEVDEARDIAVIQVPGYVGGKELPLNIRSIRWGHEIVMAGHPFGYPDLFVTRGYVANPRAHLDETRAFMMFDIAGAPGNSGSPIVNLLGEMVSILQIGFGRSFSPVTGGATSEDMRLFERFFASVVPLESR